jgi:hypothetical protein
MLHSSKFNFFFKYIFWSVYFPFVFISFQVDNFYVDGLLMFFGYYIDSSGGFFLIFSYALGISNLHNSWSRKLKRSLKLEEKNDIRPVGPVSKGFHT